MENVENSVKERLKQFIKYINISERKFCLTIGRKPAYVASIKRSISPEVLSAISKHFPQLNTIWLIQGSGEMLNAPEEKKKELTPSEVLAKLLEASTEEKARLITIIESQQETIASLTAALKKEAAPAAEAAGCAAVG